MDMKAILGIEGFVREKQGNLAKRNHKSEDRNAGKLVYKNAMERIEDAKKRILVRC